MKTICLSIFVLMVSLTVQAQSVGELQELKEEYDSIRKYNKEFQVILVRLKSGDLIKVTDNKWPAEIITTYNVLKVADNTIMIGIYPFSESGDWSMEHHYYLDSTGNVFCYELKISSFNNRCTDILKQTYKAYYDRTQKMLKTTYKTTDVNGNKIDEQGCEFNVRGDFNRKQFISLEDLIDKENLQNI